jgi:putative ABC transport system permease protein
MFIAWVNYINLSTVRSVKRAKEIGIRKVSGADRGNLIIQFLFESLWINLISIILAFTIVQLCFPIFSGAIGTEAEFYLWKEEFFWIGIISFLMLSSLITGLYPAFVVTSFKPTTVLKGKFGSSSGGKRFRRALVVTQFFVSLFMITGTYCVQKQINFLQYYETGVDIEKVLVIRAPMGNVVESENNFNLFKNKAMESSDIINVAASWTIPGEVKSALQTFNRKEKPVGNLVSLNGVTHDFIDTYGLKIRAGRNFSEDIPSDKTAIIATPTALEKLGYDQPEDALNSYLDYPRFGTEHQIIGILEDYNHYTAKFGKTDFVLMLSPVDSGYRLPNHYSLKLRTSDIKSTISRLENTWNTILPDTPFDYFFMDDYFNNAFKTERQFGSVFIFFAALAILIAFMGLFGLSSFNTIQRTKEIGIRKVLGSRTWDILSLFSVEYLKLIVISAILSTPLIYWGLHAWLEEYPNRIGLKAEIFLIPIIIVLLLTVATVAYQTIKIAIANPVKSLRYE